MIKFYELSMGDYGIRYQCELKNLTGRWKIEHLNGKCHLYVERTWGFGLFRKWIHENSIMVNEESTYINECGMTIK